jgi:hypothetical protein
LKRHATCALVATLWASSAVATCPTQADAPCPLPLVSLPPSVGVRVDGARVAMTTALTFGLRTGPHPASARPPWLLAVDLGIAWVLPATIEPWLRLTTARQWALGDAIDVGLGGSMLLPSFDATRLAGGVAGTLTVRAGEFSLRLGANVEWSAQGQVVTSASVALSPW